MRPFRGASSELGSNRGRSLIHIKQSNNELLVDIHLDSKYNLGYRRLMLDLTPDELNNLIPTALELEWYEL